jgi:predicted flap endonuclease-1-like 5' DNA nuclease
MITREKRRRGVVVTFTVLTEEAVSVVGDFNGWDPHVHPLPRSADGKRSTTIELEPGRYAFRYLAEGGRFFDDPEADFLESNGMGDSHGVLEIVDGEVEGPDDLPSANGDIALRPHAVPASIEKTIAAGPAQAAATRAHDDPAAGPSPTKAKAPKAKAPKAPKAAKGAAGDQLERIEGIGPKIGDALRAAGLDSFARLAGVSDDALREALARAELRFAPSLGSWAAQARLLADGDEAGFEALTARLTAGRPAKGKPAKAKPPKG